MRLKCVCGRGSAPNPAGGAYSAPPDPLAGGEGAAAPSPRTPSPLSASTWPPYFEIASAATESQAEAQLESRLGEFRGELLRSHAKSSSAKTVPAVNKTLSASTDVEYTLCDNDDDDSGSHPCVQAPRDRNPLRSGMPRSAFEVDGGHRSVVVDGSDRFESAERVSSLHTDPIEHSVPLPNSNTAPPLMGNSGYTRTAYTMDRGVSGDDGSLRESSLQIGGTSFGASSARVAGIPPTRDFGGSLVPRAEPTTSAPGEPAEWAAGTLLSLRDSSGGKAPHVHADAGSADGARTYTHTRTHFG